MRPRIAIRMWLSFPWQDREILLPRSNLGAILKRHGFGDLMKVVQIVNDPRRDQLAQRHATQRRVHAAAIQLLPSQTQGSQVIEVLRPQSAKGLQQLGDS